MPPNRTLFAAESGTFVPAVTADQMREVDRIAVVETGPNLFQMMENAGRELAHLALEKLGNGWLEKRVLVLAGGGGNGGGGICAGRHMANHGVNVTLCLSDPERLGEVPRFQHQIYRYAGGAEIARGQLDESHPDIILDALIGYGLNAAPNRGVSRIIEWANGSGAPILSLDVPSGVDATTGETPGVAIHPQWTLTLALPKTGLLPQRTGEIFLADIGIPLEVYRRMKLDYTPPFGCSYRTHLVTRSC